jgi:hypothetical protein
LVIFELDYFLDTGEPGERVEFKIKKINPIPCFFYNEFSDYFGNEEKIKNKNKYEDCKNYREIINIYCS